MNVNDYQPPQDLSPADDFVAALNELIHGDGVEDYEAGSELLDLGAKMRECLRMTGTNVVNLPPAPPTEEDTTKVKITRRVRIDGLVTAEFDADQMTDALKLAVIDAIQTGTLFAADEAKSAFEGIEVDGVVIEANDFAVVIEDEDEDGQEMMRCCVWCGRERLEGKLIDDQYCSVACQAQDAAAGFTRPLAVEDENPAKI